MTMDMIIRKKALKIQERLGMNIGIAYGINRIPVVKTTEQAMTALKELYRIGIRAFLLPKELFSGILTTTDLYKNYYGELLKINEITTSLRVKAKIGIETTGRSEHVGSLEDVIDIVKRTHGTEPVINWAHVHARGYGALRTGSDYMRIISKLKNEIAHAW